MDNIFDNMKGTAFSVIATCMGADAFWYMDGDIETVPIKARILFNDPSTNEEIGNHEYTFGRTVIEYKEGDWPGLKELSDEKTIQVVSIKGIYYYVFKVVSQDGKSSTSKDGDTFVAYLDKANDL